MDTHRVQISEYVFTILKEVLKSSSSSHFHLSFLIFAEFQMLLDLCYFDILLLAVILLGFLVLLFLQSSFLFSCAIVPSSI